MIKLTIEGDPKDIAALWGQGRQCPERTIPGELLARAFLAAIHDTDEVSIDSDGLRGSNPEPAPE